MANKVHKKSATKKPKRQKATQAKAKPPNKGLKSLQTTQAKAKPIKPTAVQAKPKQGKPKLAKPQKIADKKQGDKTLANKQNNKPKFANNVNIIKHNTQETYPHFRYYYISGHPALITAEHSQTEYKFRKVMHNKKDGRHTNEEIKPNLDPKDPDPMYIVKRVRHDKKKNFAKNKYPWVYPKK